MSELQRFGMKRVAQEYLRTHEGDTNFDDLALKEDNSRRPPPI